MPPQFISGDINTLDAEELRSTLKSLGISRIDTAARYGNGESERKLGRAKFADDFTIDTKISIDPGKAFLSPEAIESSLNNSLETLGLKQVNTIYCHGPDHQTPIADQAKAFDKHYREGKFRRLGVSNFSPEMLQEWLDIADREGYVKPSVFQGQYNLLCRAHEEKLFPLLWKHGIHYAAYSPLAGGFLLGNFTAEGVQGGRRFATGSLFTGFYDHVSMHEAIHKLRAISEKAGVDMGELSIRWLKYHSVLNDEDVIIIGGSKPSHYINSVTQASNGPLPDDVATEMTALWEGVKKEGREIINSLEKMKT